jgi:hypothetical protein
MKSRTFLKILLGAFAAPFMPPLLAQPNSPDGLTYKTGYSAMMKLGRSLYDGLDDKQKKVISAQPISLDVDTSPSVRLMFYPDADLGGAPLRGVWISAGFIDLVNHVAHARAINLIQKGYWDKYVTILGQELGDKELKPLPDDSNAKFWTETMLNEQQSNFNSIVGIVTGILLAHHTLGHYDKYKDIIGEKDGKWGRPINEVLTDKEWEDAYKTGLVISLRAGCFTEGAEPFYEAFDKMAVRPPWAIYFLPAKVKYSAKMKKDFKKIQADFLAGKTQ